MNPLTTKQSNVLAFITCFINNKGCSPTIQEIADNFKYKSVYSAQCHINALIKKGAITATPNDSRSIKVVPGDGCEWKSTSLGEYPKDVEDYLATDGVNYYIMFYDGSWVLSNVKNYSADIGFITHWSEIPKIEFFHFNHQ